jgi:hypothetical protein
MRSSCCVDRRETTTSSSSLLCPAWLRRHRFRRLRHHRFRRLRLLAVIPNKQHRRLCRGITAPGGSVLCGCQVYRYALIVASAAAFAVAFTVASASIAAFISIPAFIPIPVYASASCHHHPACTADVHPFSFSLF